MTLICKKPVGNFAARNVRKFRDAPLDGVERSRRQSALRQFNVDAMTASTSIHADTSALEASGIIASAVGLDSELVMFMLGEHLCDKTRKHTKLCMMVRMGCERGSDIYRLNDINKKTVLCVSTATHGPANALLAMQMLAVAFMVGLSGEERGSSKRAMRRLVVSS